MLCRLASPLTFVADNDPSHRSQSLIDFVWYGSFPSNEYRLYWAYWKGQRRGYVLFGVYAYLIRAISSRAYSVTSCPLTTPPSALHLTVVMPEGSEFWALSGPPLGLETVEEHIEVLSTPYVPSPTEKANIRARCAARHRESEQITGLIKELKERRIEIKRLCSIAETLLSHIRILPEELLVEIFMYCLPEVTPKLLNHSSRSGRRRGSVFPDINLHPRHVRSNLAQVCQLWAKVVNATPTLWGRLCLDHPLENPEQVDDWLEKGESTLLDVFIRPIRWYGAEREADTDATIGLIRNHFSRVRTLVVDAKGATGSAIPSLLPNDALTEAPMLRTLAFEKVDHHHTSQELGQLDAPNLHTLVLRCYDQIFTHLTERTLFSVRRFTVEVCDSTSLSYLPILSMCPNLEYLDWTDFDPPTEADYELPPIVTLMSLKSLQYATEYSGEQSTQFLMCLQAPNLESFTFRAAEAGSRAYILDTIEAFLHDGASKLRQLQLRNVDTSAQGIESLLSILPNLRTLIFGDESVIDQSLFISLCSFSLCPNLHALELVNVAHFPSGPLVKLIFSRTRENGALVTPGLLHKLGITGGAPNEILSFLVSERSETIKFTPGSRRGGGPYGVMAWGEAPHPDTGPNGDDDGPGWGPGNGWGTDDWGGGGWDTPVLAHALPPQGPIQVV